MKTQNHNENKHGHSEMISYYCTAPNRKLTILQLVITGTSAPEFFTNIMGTFVTKSDLGIGTIVGSAVFNIFGVISVCGLFRSVG